MRAEEGSSPFNVWGIDQIFLLGIYAAYVRSSAMFPLMIPVFLGILYVLVFRYPSKV